jgi:TetR/AcrR family transcriptional regulator, lmrAB and yxaGH operons repressor
LRDYRPRVTLQETPTSPRSPGTENVERQTRSGFLSPPTSAAICVLITDSHLFPTERSVILDEMRPNRTSRPEIVKKLSEVFRRDSYSGASLADLAAAVDLGKASLYQKFPEGKAQMGAEVLTEIGRSLESQVLSVLRQDGPPADRFNKMLVAVSKFYNGGRLSCLIDTLSLGKAGELYRPALTEAIKQWEQALADLAREAGQSATKAAIWAEEVLITIEGSLVLARAKNDPQVFRRALKNLGRAFANRSS